MPRAYQKMRGYLQAEGYEQTDVAEELGRSITYVSNRYTGKEPWNQDEMYKIMDLIKQPYDRLHEIFPKGGIA